MPVSDTVGNNAVKVTIANAYHNLSTLLAAGVPLLRSLEVTAQGLKRSLRRACLKLRDGAAEGRPLAESMERMPSIFEPLDVTIVRASEVSGDLPESLALLAKWHEFQLRIKRRILSGLALPIFLIHAVAVLAPVPGYFLGGRDASAYGRQVFGILLLFYVPAAVVLFVRYFTPRRGLLRAMLDKVVLRIPVLGAAGYRLSLSRYCWVFHMLLKAGVPIIDCAANAAAASGNAVVRRRVAGGTASARAGNAVSEGFSSKLPAEFLNIWRVGEESGQLEQVTKRLADNYGQSADFMYGEFATWLPRLVYFAVVAITAYFIIRNIGIVRRAVF